MVAAEAVFAELQRMATQLGAAEVTAPRDRQDRWRIQKLTIR